MGLDSYGEGKLALIKNWMANHAPSGGFEAVEGWSDSINDKPLLEFAAGFQPHGRAVAANPDPQLARLALERGWEVASVFRK